MNKYGNTPCGDSTIGQVMRDALYDDIDDNEDAYRLPREDFDLLLLWRRLNAADAARRELYRTYGICNLYVQSVQSGLDPRDFPPVLRSHVTSGMSPESILNALYEVLAERYGWDDE